MKSPEEIMYARFVRERNEALFSLDKQKIIRLGEKYMMKFPKTELVFWAAVYKAILQIAEAPDELKYRARVWLRENRFREMFL